MNPPNDPNQASHRGIVERLNKCLGNESNEVQQTPYLAITSEKNPAGDVKSADDSVKSTDNGFSN